MKADVIFKKNLYSQAKEHWLCVIFIKNCKMPN